MCTLSLLLGFYVLERTTSEYCGKDKGSTSRLKSEWQDYLQDMDQA